MLRLMYLVGIALLTFLIGISAYRIKVGLSFASIEMIPVEQLREDQWHKLYEAAMMADDPDTRQDILARLMCMGPDYALEGLLIVQGVDDYCVKPDGSVHLKSYGRLPDNSYVTLLHEHHSWVMRHIGFLSEVKTKEKAKAYVVMHRL